ncbi:MAG: right-handed parallel beta-helix repeat-containing protein [Pseudomonadales bacterium]
MSARLLFLAMILHSCPIRAIEVGPGDDLRSAISRLTPGDELLLLDGIYTLNSGFRVTATGTEAAPVVIRAKGPGVPVIVQTNRAHNVMEVIDSQYLEIRDLEITGGSHGIRLMNSSHITIEGCEIHDTGDVALSANAGGTYRDLRLVRNHIHHTNGTGEGMYLGCNHDECRVANSLIEGNYIHHTNGPDVVQGDGIELKEGSYGNVIRNNVIHDTRYPNILTYSTAGNGPPNIIEGNVMWGSEDNAMQSAADAIIRNNVILGAPVVFQAHQAGRPSNIEFVHNTVVNVGNAVNVRNVTGPVLIANNALYSRRGAAIKLISGNRNLVTLRGNVGQGGVSGGAGGYREGLGISADFVNGHFSGKPPIDLVPARGSSLLGAGDPEFAVAFDFDGTARRVPPDAGAYTRQTVPARGWQIRAGFKPVSGGGGEQTKATEDDGD